MKKLPGLLALSALAFAAFGQPESAVAQPVGCPPGLAKKNPPCVPPGQAKKGQSATEWRNHRLGTTPRQDDLNFLDNYWQYDLPSLPSGQRYAVFDNRIVVVDRESYEILQLIRAFTALTY